MMRIRLVTARSAFPFVPVEGQELDPVGVQVQEGARGRAVYPPAAFARVHDERVAARPGLAAVRAAVHEERVRLERAGLYFADVVHQKDSASADLEGVRRLVHLDPDPG